MTGGDRNSVEVFQSWPRVDDIRFGRLHVIKGFVSSPPKYVFNLTIAPLVIDILGLDLPCQDLRLLIERVVVPCITL